MVTSTTPAHCRGRVSDETISGESQSVELGSYDPMTARTKRVVRLAGRPRESRLQESRRGMHEV